MILYNINDVIREDIYYFFEEEAFNYLKTLDEKEEERIIKLIASDALKVLTLKKKKGTILFDDSKQLYEFLKEAEYDEIKFYIDDDIEWFSKLFLQAKQFYELPIIDRCLMMRLFVQDGTVRELCEFDLSALLDGMTYSIQKDIENFNHYYCDYKEKAGIEHLDAFYRLIFRLMEELKNEDKLSFDKIYLDILKNFYVLKNYLESVSQVPLGDGIDAQNLLEEQPIENSSVKIYESINLFCEVVAYHFLYENNNLFNKEQIKVYAKKHIDPKMKEKLKIQ